jgi:hypothetical protein
MKSKAETKKGRFKDLKGVHEPFGNAASSNLSLQTLRKLSHVNLSIRVGERFLVGQRPMPIEEMGRTTTSM